eukprot:scpid75690/ scgid7335/ 
MRTMRVTVGVLLQALHILAVAARGTPPTQAASPTPPAVMSNETALSNSSAVELPSTTYSVIVGEMSIAQPPIVYQRRRLPVVFTAQDEKNHSTNGRRTPASTFPTPVSATSQYEEMETGSLMGRTPMWIAVGAGGLFVALAIIVFALLRRKSFPNIEFEHKSQCDNNGTAQHAALQKDSLSRTKTRVSMLDNVSTNGSPKMGLSRIEIATPSTNKMFEESAPSLEPTNIIPDKKRYIKKKPTSLDSPGVEQYSFVPVQDKSRNFNLSDISCSAPPDSELYDNLYKSAFSNGNQGRSTSSGSADMANSKSLSKSTSNLERLFRRTPVSSRKNTFSVSKNTSCEVLSSLAGTDVVYADADRIGEHIQPYGDIAPVAVLRSASDSTAKGTDDVGRAKMHRHATMVMSELSQRHAENTLPRSKTFTTKNLRSHTFDGSSPIASNAGEHAGLASNIKRIRSEWAAARGRRTDSNVKDGAA